MIIKIEFENTKITLSVGAEGVVLDAPVIMDEETRQTTLSEAQWGAYAQGRADEARHWNERFKAIIVENEGANISDVAKEIVEDFPAFEELVEVPPRSEQVVDDEKPPMVDPVTGNIAGWVKTFREAEHKRRRAPEVQPREQCRSSCCGTLGARMRDGSCWGCR